MAAFRRCGIHAEYAPAARQQLVEALAAQADARPRRGVYINGFGRARYARHVFNSQSSGAQFHQYLG